MVYKEPLPQAEDGRLLCVPMTDARALDYDPETEGSGLDRRPVYDIDGRVQEEGLSSWLCVYDTESGRLLYEKTVPKCWITHVQFNPADPEVQDRPVVILCCFADLSIYFTSCLFCFIPAFVSHCHLCSDRIH